MQNAINLSNETLFYACWLLHFADTESPRNRAFVRSVNASALIALLSHQCLRRAACWRGFDDNLAVYCRKQAKLARRFVLEPHRSSPGWRRLGTKSCHRPPRMEILWFLLVLVLTALFQAETRSLLPQQQLSFFQSFDDDESIVGSGDGSEPPASGWLSEKGARVLPGYLGRGMRIDASSVGSGFAFGLR